MQTRDFIKWLPSIRSGSTSAYAVAVAAVVLGTLLRFGVGAVFGQGAIPYASYYPAVLIAAIIGGGRSGVLTMVLGALAGYLLFSPSVPVVPSENMPAVPIVSTLLYFLNCGLIIGFAVVYRMAVADLVQERDRVVMLSGELHHRIKNMGAVVQAVVTRTLGPQHPSTSTLKHRIAVLISNHVQLEGKAQSGHVREIVDTELGPYGDARVQSIGDDVALGTHATLCLTLVIHELATNALKHGALSGTTGHVRVSWKLESGGVAFSWIESDGPRVPAANGSGFGTVLLNNILGECGGRITLDFNPEGLRADFLVPDPPIVKSRG